MGTRGFVVMMEKKGGSPILRFATGWGGEHVVL
jgi:hypothetical protein